MIVEQHLHLLFGGEANSKLSQGCDYQSTPLAHLLARAGLCLLPLVVLVVTSRRPASPKVLALARDYVVEVDQ